MGDIQLYDDAQLYRGEKMLLMNLSSYSVPLRLPKQGILAVN